MGPGGVNDVTHRKRGLRFEKRRRLTFGDHRGLTAGAARDGGGTEWKVSIERLCLSSNIEKPFNSKIIKSFVPELRSRECFFVFRDSYVLCIYVMNILYLFHISISWVSNTHTRTIFRIYIFLTLGNFSRVPDQVSRRKRVEYFNISVTFTSRSKAEK